MKNTVKYYLVLLNIIVIQNYNLAQKQGYNWCFGDSAGINFNNNVSFVSSCYPTYYNPEGSASISDNNGNLLFYTEGTTVWNRNHKIMPNGTELSGNASITNGCIITPNPGDSLQYYIYCISQKNAYPNTFDGFCYSVVDMRLDSGRGDIVATKKNIVLINNTKLCEKVTAVKHGNGRDWWALVHGFNNSLFYKYLITPAGIALADTQSIGSIVEGVGGEIEFNQNGDKLVLVDLFYDIDLFDFNRCNGTLSNWIIIYKNEKAPNPNFDMPFYGCSFSPNGNYLYVSTYEDSLFQYNIASNNTKDIAFSRQLIWHNPYYIDNPPPSIPSYRIGQHELGPNNKIYISLPYFGWPYSVFSSFNQNLCVINSPDSLGLACNFVPCQFSLGSSSVYLGLPNMPNYNLGVLTGSICDTLSSINEFIETKEEINIFPNPATDAITIAFSNKAPANTTFEVYDLLGNKVLSKPINTKTKQETISVSQLSEGVYLYKVKADNKAIHENKLIIIR